MNSFAQTNIQLYSQFREAGYSQSDSLLVYRAYHLVTHLFTGRFRGSGKTFMAHLIGTASILGSLGVKAEIVVAGLLHAVYEFGDFGDGSKGISSRKRERVVKLVGQNVESYIVGYTALRWNERTIPEIYDRLTALNSFERDVLLMRLANELEDHLDLGVLYCGNVEKRLQHITATGDLIVAMATFLEVPTLAAALSQVFQDTVSAHLPTELQNESDYSYCIPTSPSAKRWLGETLACYRHWSERILAYVGKLSQRTPQH
jgi:(p)ppGpp synthase/HD superfamily hydrolase